MPVSYLDRLLKTAQGEARLPTPEDIFRDQLGATHPNLHKRIHYHVFGRPYPLDADTLQGHPADYFAPAADLVYKQDKFTGVPGQVLSFDQDGNLISTDPTLNFHEITRPEVNDIWNMVFNEE